MKNINFQDGVDLVDMKTGEPFCLDGAPLSCSELRGATPSVAGVSLVGAFVSIGLPTIGEAVTTTRFVSADAEMR